MNGPSGTESKFPEGYCLGHYEIRRLLGSGAFADVYLARHKLLDKEVALKVIRDTEAEAWEQQGAKIMCRLQHPSIVNVHFADRIDGRLVIAMDYVAGKTLREILQERKLALTEAIEIATSLAEALDYFHNLELETGWHPAHLDLKPSNILIDAGGTAKITDFGMAQMLHVESGQAVAMGGSPAYMAPEQFENKPSQQSDLWAVGVLFYEMLLGHPPFRAQSLEEYREAICAHDPQFAADFVALPDAVREIIRKCLQRDPTARFGTAKELAQALCTIDQESHAKKCPDCGASLLPESDICPECTLPEEKKKSKTQPWQPELKPPSRKSRERTTLLILAFVLVAAILSYGGYSLWRDLRPEWISRKALEEAARPGVGAAEREGILQKAVARLEKGSARARMEKLLLQATAAKEKWQAIQALERSAESGEGSYEDRIRALREFTTSYGEMAESRQASERLKVWEDESRRFQEAEKLDEQASAHMCAVLARWQDFHARQQTGLRRAYSWDRIQYWTGQVENYEGYAELTVKSASGLPPARGLLSGGGQPHPYFVLLQAGRILYRSHTLAENPSPVWDEKIRVLVRRGTDFILEIRDQTLVGYTLLLHQVLTPFPVDGPFRLRGGSIEANLEILREK